MNKNWKTFAEEIPENNQSIAVKHRNKSTKKIHKSELTAIVSYNEWKKWENEDGSFKSLDQCIKDGLINPVNECALNTCDCEEPLPHDEDWDVNEYYQELIHQEEFMRDFINVNRLKYPEWKNRESVWIKEDYK